jgi:hypothetical protein
MHGDPAAAIRVSGCDVCFLTSSWQNQGFSATAAARIAKHRHMRNMLLLIMPGVVDLDDT